MTDTTKLAFPCTGEGHGNGQFWTPGMSLREYVAIQAMNGLLAGDHPITHEADPTSKVALVAVLMADRLIEELAK